MTVGGLLALSAGMKFLWLLCCTALIFLLCARASNAAATVGCAALCGGIARPDGGQHAAVAAESQPLAAGGRPGPVREAVYLNLLGSPSDRVLCGAIFLLVLALAAGIVGAALYAQTPGGAAIRLPAAGPSPGPGTPAWRDTNCIRR